MVPWEAAHHYLNRRAVVFGIAEVIRVGRRHSIVQFHPDRREHLELHISSRLANDLPLCRGCTIAATGLIRAPHGTPVIHIRSGDQIAVAEWQQSPRTVALTRFPLAQPPLVTNRAPNHIRVVTVELERRIGQQRQLIGLLKAHCPDILTLQGVRSPESLRVGMRSMLGHFGLRHVACIRGDRGSDGHCAVLSRWPFGAVTTLHHAWPEAGPAPQAVIAEIRLTASCTLNVVSADVVPENLRNDRPYRARRAAWLFERLTLTRGNDGSISVVCGDLGGSEFVPRDLYYDAGSHGRIVVDRDAEWGILGSGSGATAADQACATAWIELGRP